MTIQFDRIPMPKDKGRFRQVSIVDGTPHEFEFNWNTREDRWYLNLYTLDGTLVMAGIKLVSNYLLTYRYTYDGRPAAEFMVADMTGNDNDATLENFDREVIFTIVYDDGES